MREDWVEDVYKMANDLVTMGTFDLPEELTAPTEHWGEGLEGPLAGLFDFGTEALEFGYGVADRLYGVGDKIDFLQDPSWESFGDALNPLDDWFGWDED